MASKIVLCVLILAFFAVQGLAYTSDLRQVSVRSETPHFGQVVRSVNIQIIDNNMDLIKRFPDVGHCEIGLDKPAFRAYVYHYLERSKIQYKRLRFIICKTMLQREAYRCAVLYF